MLLFHVFFYVNMLLKDAFGHCAHMSFSKNVALKLKASHNFPLSTACVWFFSDNNKT